MKDMTLITAVNATNGQKKTAVVNHVSFVDIDLKNLAVIKMNNSEEIHLVRDLFVGISKELVYKKPEEITCKITDSWCLDFKEVLDEMETSDQSLQ